jgi:hypothetical protein
VIEFARIELKIGEVSEILDKVKAADSAFNKG